MEQKNVLLLLTPKSSLAYVESKMDVRQAFEKMRAHGYLAIPVLDKQGVYLGTITEGDILDLYISYDGDLKEAEKQSVRMIIRKQYNPAVKVDASFDELANMIVEQNFVPVVDDRNILMGIVTRKRVLQELLNNGIK